MTPHLSTAQTDRAAGVLLGMACGDALGAGYEFGPPLGPDVSVTMTGGGPFGWAPGEWTDDTSMAIAIAEVTATGADLRTEEAPDQVAARWAGWATGAKDVGAQTRAVLSAATRSAATRAAVTRAAASRGEGEPTAADLRLAAEALHARSDRSGGNGSLMRTAPVALAYLHDPVALVHAACEISAMTHHDLEAGEACALWCLAIRRAVLTGTLNVRNGLEHLPEGRARIWAARLDEAEAGRPADFDHNGWVVQALQGAWSAITTTATDGAITTNATQEQDLGIPRDLRCTADQELGIDRDSRSTADQDLGIDRDPRSAADQGMRTDRDSRSSTAGPAHFRLALEAAVRGGRDTDTVAAIAGALVGGLYGASAVPATWRRKLHGWPGLRARDLVALGVMTAHRGQPGSEGWPAGARVDYSKYRDSDALARHPHDDQVWLGGVDTLDNLPDGVDAVVSLCRLGATQVPAPGVAPGDHLEVWLIDEPGQDKNPNLDFVLADAAAAVSTLRAEGRTVLLHCVQAQSRTPAVAALYGARLTGHTATDALADIVHVLPRADPNRGLRAALERLG